MTGIELVLMENDRAAQVDEGQSEDKSTRILICVHLRDLELYHTGQA